MCSVCIAWEKRIVFSLDLKTATESHLPHSYTYSFTGTGWHCLTVIHRIFWWLMKGCVGQRFCDAVGWIVKLVRVKKLEIS